MITNKNNLPESQSNFLLYTGKVGEVNVEGELQMEGLNQIVLQNTLIPKRSIGEVRIKV